MKVLARRLGRFAEDMILKVAQEGSRSLSSSLDQWLVLRDVCELRKREKISYLAFLDVTRQMTVF